MAKASVSYDEVMKPYASAEELVDLIKDADGNEERPNVREDRRKEVLKRGYEFKKDRKELNPNVVKSHKDLKYDDAKEALSRLNREIISSGAHKIQNNLESVVDSIPADKLGRIALQEQILGRANAKEKEVIGGYLALQDFEEFYNKYMGSKTPQPLSQFSERDRKRIISAAAKGASIDAENREKARQQAEGYTESVLIEGAKNAAAGALQTGYFDDEDIRNFAKDGLDAQLDENRKQYQDIVKEAKGKDVNGIAKDYLKNMLGNTKESEEFKTGRELMYRAYKNKLSVPKIQSE